MVRRAMLAGREIGTGGAKKNAANCLNPNDVGSSDGTRVSRVPETNVEGWLFDVRYPAGKISTEFPGPDVCL